MAKSQVERYEQLLAGDPTSTVFVELAKALIARGDCLRALEVCSQGLTHHPRSVAGRVQWGKALIHLNRPAEAMEQFDQAMAIDRDNPYAYNLISEVLLKRGLYRSALPILRKAVALQPEDGRMRGWLEQTQAALAGGPAPALQDGPQEAPPEGGAEEPALPPASAAPAASTTLVDDRTVSGMQIPAELLAQMVPPPEERHPEHAAPFPTPTPTPAGRARPGPVRGPVPRLTPVGHEPLPPPVFAPGEEEGGEAGGAGERTEVMRAGDLQRAVEAARQAQEGGGGGAGGLLGDLPPPPADEPRPSSPAAGHRTASRAGAPRRGGGLLADLPELAETSGAAGATAPAAGVRGAAAGGEETAEAAARAYEQELKKRLGVEGGGAAPAPGARRRTLMLAAAAVGVAALGAFLFFFISTRKDFGGRDLQGALAEARRLVAEDTPASLDSALLTLAAAVGMDEGDAEAWALTGLAQAMRAAEHGGGAAARTAAHEALAREGVAEAHPGVKLAADWLLAQGAARAAEEARVLASPLEDAHVHALAGRLLLARGEPGPALSRFQKALQLDPQHGRALLSLGDYYRREGDVKQALAMYERVGAAHPERVLGLAELHLQQGQELQAAARELEAVPAAALATPALSVRHKVVLGRVRSALGLHPEALAALQEALASLGGEASGPLGLEVQLALSEARRLAGDGAGAQAAAEAALALAPRGGADARADEALEALGRALLARDRERDALGRLGPEGAGRRAALVRGLARARLGEWKAARGELARTAVGGRYPPEAVVTLALADAAEGAPERAQEVLEKVLLSTRKARSEVRVALGRVYWQRGAFDKARSQFEEAMREPDGAEGACALGRLFLSQGALEQALEPLQRAAAAQPEHGEARDALGRALLGLGRTEQALKQFEAWQLETPGAARAHRGHAHALYLLGRLEQAEGAAGRAVKLDPTDAAASRLEALVLAARGEGERAFRSLQRANRLDPRDPDTFCEIGLTLLRRGQADNATKAFEAALREDPRAACGLAGRHLAGPPDRRAAPAVARRLRQLVEEAPYSWDKALARTALSRALLAGGAATEARAAAEQAVAQMPVSGWAHQALGEAALRGRDTAGALQAFERAVQLDPGNAPLRLALAEALADSEAGAPRAVEAYEAFLRLDAPAAEQARVRKLLPALRRRAEGR
jgi:tetratricopeptide (TPR) repeat protein